MPTIYGSTGNSYIDAKIEYSCYVVEEVNASYITASLYYKRNNTGQTTYGTGTFSLTIEGNKKSETKTLTITENAWVLAMSHSAYVVHKADGIGAATISASGSIPGTTLTSTSISLRFALETIPKATTIDSLSCATSYFNGEMTYKYTPKNADYYTRCNIAFNLDGTYTAVKTVNLGQQTKGQKTATVTLSENELSIIYNKLPSSPTKGTLRFTLRTYSDSGYSTQVGDATFKEITLHIPNISATQPTATITLSPVNSLASPFTSLYIKGKTKVDVNFTNGAGKYGASIVSYNVTIGGKTYGSPYTSEYITTDGEVEVKSTVTDSRGFSRTYTQTVSFIPYANPRIIPASNEDEIICARCDASGTLSESGTYLKIKAKRDYSKVVSGSQKNFCSIRYRYKPDGGSYSSWATILADSATSDEITTGALLGGALSLTSSYVVQVGVIDTLGESANTTIPIPTEKVYMHKAGSIRSLGLGKYAEEENSFDVAEDITAIFRGDVQFKGESWTARALGTNVTESTVNSGRWGGTGVFYRVCAGGKHIYVAFNVSFKTSTSTVRAESETIPSAYRPSHDVYALCPVGFSDDSRGIATVSISPSGRVNIYAVHKLPGATLSSGDTVKWIDGYVDYWT